MNDSLKFLIVIITLFKCSNCIYDLKVLEKESSSSNTFTSSIKKDCPPWAYWKNNSCMCLENISYGVECDRSNLQLSVQLCSCATYENETQQITSGKCMETCNDKDCNRDEPGNCYFRLPADPLKINKFMCESKWNRTGRLCGKCLPGYAPLVYSYDMKCMKCPEGNSNIWKYTLVAYGPLTLFYFVVLYFKINTISSHLHGFLYYSQAITVPTFLRIFYLYASTTTATKLAFIILTPLYSIWSLDILKSLPFDICLNVSRLTLFAMDYGLALYPLLLTVLSYILIELHDRNYRVIVFIWRPFRCVLLALRRNWNVRNTVVDVYTSFFLLSFVKVLNISVDILTPTRATDLVSGNSTWVLYYDGTVDYFGAEHLPYAILAIVMTTLMVVLPGILFVLYPFRWFQRFLSKLPILRGSHLLPTIMDSFQGCYKDGTEPGTRDYRWFATVPFLLRFIMFSFWPFSLDISIYPWAAAIVVVGLLLTIIIQPYKNDLTVYTKIDSLFLGLLTITYLMAAGLNIADISHQSLIQIYLILLVISFIIPFLCMIIIPLYWKLSGMRRGLTLCSYIRAWRRGYEPMEDNLPDRLVNPEQYEGSVIHLPVSN